MWKTSISGRNVHLSLLPALLFFCMGAESLAGWIPFKQVSPTYAHIFRLNCCTFQKKLYHLVLLNINHPDFFHRATTCRPAWIIEELGNMSYVFQLFSSLAVQVLLTLKKKERKSICKLTFVCCSTTLIAIELWKARPHI